VRVITLARKPLVGSVADNVLRHSTGGLNIDATRIGYQSDADKASATPQGSCTAMSGRLAGKVQGGGDRSEFERPPQKGRWPANVILEHTSECRQVGTKKVEGWDDIRGGNEVGEGGQFGTDIYGDSKGRTKATPRGYGVEEVPAWDCHPECPVKALDDQSGPDRGAFAPVRGSEPSEAVKTVYGQRERIEGVFHGDTGGASRFFKQVGGDDRADQE